jgi:hypothetical protein
MNKVFFGFSIFIPLFLLDTSAIYAAVLNIAKPDIHPYVDPAGGRENHEHTDQKVNEVRVYDFYQRQADYYIANPDKIPEIIPSFPDLMPVCMGTGENIIKIIIMTGGGMKEKPENILPMS